MKLAQSLKPFAFALTALTALVAIGASTFASGCVHDDGSVSVCHAAQLAITAGGIVGLVCSVASLFARGAKSAGVLFVVCALCGLFIAASPGMLFELCMMETMRCHAIMQPFAQIAGVLIAALGAIAAWRAFRMD